MPESLDAVQVAAAFLLGLLCIALAVVLLRPVWLPIWRLFQGTQQFLEDWFGEPARPGQTARPGAMERLAQVEAGVADVKVVALRSEKELHPNGGGSLRDDVRTVSAQVAQVQEAAQQATTAAGLAVNEAKVAANVAQETATERRADARNMRASMEKMRGDIAQDAADRTADAFELLEARTRHRTDGPIDLRGEVLPHAHELPARARPDMTGGPVDPAQRHSDEE